MNAREAYAKLASVGIPVVETAEAAALFRQSVPAASSTLARLAAAGLITRVRSGLWWVAGPVRPNRIAEYLAAPYPSYLSLQTALRLRGMIEQIPEIIYVVSLGRTQRVSTGVGTFSIHHVRPELFGGFDDLDGLRVATPEKSIFDLAYLSGGRSRLFTNVPELTLPSSFRARELDRWIRRIPSARSRTLVRNRLQKLLAGAA
jgi:predicted transcriptional regulator of viral defense system